MSTSRPWLALWAMLVGFFMTLIDWTAVSVANPSLMAALDADYESVVWVTSAYLLGFAVPLLVAGRHPEPEFHGVDHPVRTRRRVPYRRTGRTSPEKGSNTGGAGVGAVASGVQWSRAS